MERYRDLLWKNLPSLPCINPFVHKITLTRRQKIQVFIMSITVAPMRAIMVVVTMFAGWLIIFIATRGVNLRVQKPASAWRRFLFQTAALIGRLQFFAMGFHWVNVKGKRASSSMAKVLAAAPHSSFFDCLLWFCTMPLPSCVALIKNAQYPVVGTLAKALQPVFVSWSDPQSRKRTVQEIRRRAGSSEDWPQIIIFPEGKCTNRQGLIPFKVGAFTPGVPVQPVTIRYPGGLDTYTWTMNGPGVAKLFWLTLCQIHNRCEIEFLPVYYPSDEEVENPKLFAENVRQVMAEALCIPCIDYTSEDYKLWIKPRL